MNEKKIFEQLARFNKILNNSDLEFIANECSTVSKILYFLNNPSNKDEKNIRSLQSFLNHLARLYEWAKTKKLPILDKAYLVISKLLVQGIRILKANPEYRRAISRGYCHKLKKVFLKGLQMLVNGLYVMFDPDIVSFTRINEKQLRNYFLNKDYGLASKFSFNTKGDYAFVKKIEELNKQELIIVERLLLKPSNQVRTVNGWMDLGMKKCPVRILCSEHNKVCFLYKNNNKEKPAYEEQLKTPPSEVELEFV